ncbi:ROK family protein [Pseudonocardia sp. WMMC193]|uniref:ROK family protein n=1 Tax=Pseudonocardia sp. WMMC193 TaxID=2911965 RepID=UPI001F3FA7ED|nr:ROK family protein [Pseudonocardia sp. WMMC193]MCF7547906.1 ROK family protein [Pseudonocardia sp. WMMC193]
MTGTTLFMSMSNVKTATIAVNRLYGDIESTYSACVNRSVTSAGRLTLAAPPRVARTGEVLDLVRRGVATTTTELATTMGVARSTVTERLDLLMRHDLVVADGETSSGRGRPASRLAFNGGAGVTLAAQVGMSGTLTAVTDLAGEVLWIDQVHLDVAEGPDAVSAMLADRFTTGLDAVGGRRRVHGVGIGLPGDIEIAARNGGGGVPWDGDAITARLAGRFDCPVFTDRDVNYLAVGEHRTSWPQSTTLLCLKVGTVVAAGLVINGEVVRGAGGLFGEIGHSKIAGATGPCACGSRGCLNTVAGGAVLASALRAKGHDAHTARDVTALASRGVVDALEAVRDAGVQIGEVVASAINLLNPDVVTVWGYLVDAGEQFLAGMHEAIYKNALPTSARALTLEQSRLGDDAGIRGAALTVIEHALSPERIDAYFGELTGA